MMIAMCRAHTAWFAHPTYGIAAGLQAIALDDRDERPEPPALITNCYDHSLCARNAAPDRYPAIYVRPDGPIVLERLHHTHATRDASDAAIAVRYIVRDYAAERTARDVDYMLEAVLWSVARLWDATLANNLTLPYRQRTEVQLLAPASVVYGEYEEEIGDAEVAGVVVLRYQARNTNL